MIDDEHLKRVKQAAVEKLFKVPGVRSVAIGPKYSNGQATGEMAIVVGVERKLPISQVPPSQMIPDTIDGIKTDVVESLEQIPVQCTNTIEDRTRYRPLRSGTHIQLEDTPTSLSWGTLGFFAFTTGAIPTVDQDLVVAVTCNHVVAGPDGAALIGQTIGQPTLDDCSACSPCCIDVIGKVLYGVYNAPDGSRVDGALIDLTSGLEYFNDVEEIGSITDFHPIQPSDLHLTPPHYPVKKRGRTTGLTTGDVLTVSGTSVIDGTTFSDDEIKIQPDPTTLVWCNCGPIPNLRSFACEGDSGSALLNSADEIVGMVRSRDGAGNGFATGIDILMKALGILVGTAAEEGDKRVVPPHPHAMAEAIAPPFVAAASSRQRAILDRAHEEIRATLMGRMYAELAAKHQAEIRDLISRNKRVATVWQRNNGPGILGHAMQVIADPLKSLPVEVNGVPFSGAVKKIMKTVEKFGSEALRADIAQYGQPITELSGLTYPQLLDRLRDTHVE
jgi:hypothetical protein